ncbi:Exonuclease [Carpediemonas membranifera]|uniref:Exonuclease n=1 Tax=Carpediemonas membranifera TaxID=201153 RepID=A0A8J6E0H2_9EUKA|nr:Exonuclease [Carpediemonas membranifera]|eukprot:KAG9391841.1 Exonuclease [Carpediemonas membranifera]
MTIKYFSFDVECAATGPGHNDREACSVSLVDFDGKTLFSTAINIESTILSPLTPITGMTEDDIKKGISFDDAKEKLVSFLGPNAVVVGQSIGNDLAYMKLTQGIDYHSAIDIAEGFQIRNKKYNNFDHFSLAKEVYAAYGVVMHVAGHTHDPDEDARYSIRLYRDYLHGSKKRNSPQTRALRRKMQLHNWQKTWPEELSTPWAGVEGVCSFKFNPSKCRCGQPCIYENGLMTHDEWEERRVARELANAEI